MYLNMVSFEQNLEEKIKEADKVIVAPHVYPDFDAIGSALGIANICEHFGKEAYILVNETEEHLDSKVLEVINEMKDDYHFINASNYEQIKGNNDLLITTDVNKANMISIEKDLNEFKDIMIIDHHQTDEKTIKTLTSNMYVDVFSSSASEIVTNMLLDFKVSFSAKVATALYSGIILDTNHFIKNTSSQTFIAASELLKRGANIEQSNNLLKCNNIQNLKIYKLVNNAVLYESPYGTIGIAKEDTQIYDRKEIAIAADKILNGEFSSNNIFKIPSIDNLNTSFAIGAVDKNNYHISARSTESGIDVSKIMESFGGGGSLRSGAAEIPKGESPKMLKKLRNILEAH